MTCRYEAEFKGLSYPKGCPACGLFGKCLKGYTQVNLTAAEAEQALCNYILLDRNGNTNKLFSITPDSVINAVRRLNETRGATGAVGLACPGAVGSTEPPPAAPSYTVDPPRDLPAEQAAWERAAHASLAQATAEPVELQRMTPAEIGDLVHGRSKPPIPRVTRARMMDELAEYLPDLADANLAVLAEDLFTIAHEK